MRFSISMFGLSDMRLTTLVTNTDDSAFAHARPLDDAKFAALIAEVRPTWRCEAFWVCNGEVPADLSAYDGVMITGSPASVLENTQWMQRLESLVVSILAQKIPLFGACFGHQIIAKALGSKIIRNPEGWAHGLIKAKRTARAAWSGPSDPLALYGSHIEQVADLPPGARGLFESPGCPIAGFAIENKVFTIQHHPEMSASFIADLVEEYAAHVGPDVTQVARQSLTRPANRAEFAAEIAAFFEQGAR